MPRVSCRLVFHSGLCSRSAHFLSPIRWRNMLDEGIKILGPFPIFQVILGLAVLGGGVFMIVKGLSGNGRKSPFSLEDKRAEWAAYEQLRNIEENTLKMIELLKRNGD